MDIDLLARCDVRDQCLPPGVNHDTMSDNTSKLIACSTLIVIGYLHWILYILYDSFSVMPDHSELVFLIAMILTVLMIVGFAGVIWFGFVKNLIQKDEKEIE